MDAYRFPIGPFHGVPNPSPQQRMEWMEEILGLAPALRQTVHKLTGEQLLTPYRPGGWTVQQVVHHMADNDMNAFLRFKRALTEDAPAAGTYREDLWAELGDYRMPVEPSLALLEAVHQRFASLLRTLQPADYARSFVSPTHGALSLDTALQRFVWHNRHHTAQIASLKARMGWA
ncbi:putative damage-inducible protein DinB [Paenibacillus mucilaginosus]|uniref:YfiT family bacillithiol transferase n=1 Tax=Paenibacillus mucilaginosus TaxID=61624 RepID=UPI003D1A4032